MGLIDPTQGPKPRVPLAHSDGVGLKLTPHVDGEATVEDANQVVELGAGQWIVVTLEAWTHLLQRVLELETIVERQPGPISRRAARIQRRKDSRN